MQVELKDLLTWAGMIIGLVAQWFHLKGRVALLEALQKRDRESMREGIKEIKAGLNRIEEKLDGKVDK